MNTAFWKPLLDRQHEPRVRAQTQPGRQRDGAHDQRALEEQQRQQPADDASAEYVAHRRPSSRASSPPCPLRWSECAVVPVVVVILAAGGSRVVHAVQHDAQHALAAKRLDGPLHDGTRRRAGPHDEQRGVGHGASSFASDSSPTGGVSMMTQSNGSAASSRMAAMRDEVRPAIGSGVAAPGRQNPQQRRDLRDRQLARLATVERFAQAGALRQAEHHVHARPPQVGVDQQHALGIRLAQRQRQVRWTSASSLFRHGARDDDALDAAILLDVVEGGGQPAVLLDRERRQVGVDDQP